MKVCPNCGREAEGFRRFCQHDGAVLVERGNGSAPRPPEASPPPAGWASSESGGSRPKWGEPAATTAVDERPAVAAPRTPVASGAPRDGRPPAPPDERQDTPRVRRPRRKSGGSQPEPETPRRREMVLNSGMLVGEFGYILEEDRAPKGDEVTGIHLHAVEDSEFYARVTGLVKDFGLDLDCEILETRWEIATGQYELSFEKLGEANVRSVLERYLPPTWYQQFGERRPRLVISLRNHFFSFLKCVVGFERLGRFTKLHVMMVEEHPEERFRPPERPASEMPGCQPTTQMMAGGAALLMFLGISMNQGSLAMLAVLLGVGSLIHHYVVNQKITAANAQKEAEHRNRLSEHERYLRLREILKDVLFKARGFKDEDLLLFTESVSRVVKVAAQQLCEEKHLKISRRMEGHGRAFLGGAETLEDL